MRRRVFVVAVASFAVSTFAAVGSSYVVPTTTLSALTSNNTSAANSFVSQSNGNLGATNVSKVDVHTLLYPGATTNVYAHLMLWFGPGSGHMNVGYNSDNQAQIQKQIQDMISRGIEGVIIDWYGPNNSIDEATKLVMAEAENYPGFTFAIMVDQGAIEWDSCPGCSPQQALIAQLQYIEQTYFPSSAYMTIGGQPVVTNFDVYSTYSINWNTVNAQLSTHPVFLFQNNGGFSDTLSDGSYAWVMPTLSNYGLGYLASFYDTGMSFPSEQTVGATYKGFNDTLASWGSDRIMGQQCGQTWLQTFSQINSMYNSGQQLPDLQLVTWNDYEEGTEIETGISNCLSVSGSVSKNTLQWSVNGDENTVDHYTAYISTDGQNLMPLADIAEGIQSLNLCSFSIPGGNYQLFVQAVGKPSMANQITGAVKYAPSCPTTPSQAVAFSAAPSSVTIASGSSGALTITAKAQQGSFNNAIALSCSGLPANLNCSFSPTALTPGSGTSTSTLTISPVLTAENSLPGRRNPFPIYAGFLLPVGMMGFSFFGKSQNRRRLKTLVSVAVLVAVLAAVSMVVVACGGGSASGSPVTGSTTQPAAGMYSVTVQGNSSVGQFSTVVTVTIQ
jgi:hypothetical protein